MVAPLWWLGMWAVAGALAGLLAYVIGGFGVHVLPKKVRSYDRINAVASHYTTVAMKVIGRAVMIERGTKYDIFRAKRDAKKNADKFTIGDKTAHVTNETGFLSTLAKKPFGLVPPPEEDIATYVTPELGELGKIETMRKEKDALTDGGEYQNEVWLSAWRPLAQLSGNVRRMVPGTRSLFDLAETEELYKQSQRLFGQSKTTQFMILIIAYSIGMSVTWLVLTQAGGAVPEDAVPTPPIGGGGV